MINYLNLAGFLAFRHKASPFATSTAIINQGGETWIEADLTASEATQTTER
jgi:hypothetical protein